MIRETYLELWTRVTRMVAGQVVQTTCCCPAAGAGRRDCMRAGGNKNPCRCGCHGHKLKDGVRFRQLDGPVPAKLPECMPEALAKIKADVNCVVFGGRSKAR
jgi:hypothetical protein